MKRTHILLLLFLCVATQLQSQNEAFTIEKSKEKGILCDLTEKRWSHYPTYHSRLHF